MRENGFTLIELVVAIVILGVLAVTAAPRFLGVSQDAHQASANGTFSAFRSGLTLFESACLINSGDRVITGGSASDHLLTQVEGVTAAASGSCYPSAGGTAPDGVTSDFSDCLQVWEGMLSNSPSHNTSSISISDANLISAADDFDMVIASTGSGKCSFYYVASRQGLNGPVLNYDSINGTLERQN